MLTARVLWRLCLPECFTNRNVLFSYCTKVYSCYPEKIPGNAGDDYKTYNYDRVKVKKPSQPLLHMFLPLAPNSLDAIKAKKYQNIKTPIVRYRFKVFYPDEYTIKPLTMHRLAGRDPVTGRVIVGTLGGGFKRDFLWVDHTRKPCENGSPYVERIIKVFKDVNQSAFVALVASGSHARYILATLNMKVGDVIKTYGEIPRIPIRANEGDSHPVGALTVGTIICCIEQYPGKGGFFCLNAGTFGTIIRKVDNQVHIKLPSKKSIIVQETCMATVGRLSNIDHHKEHIGSPNRLRHLGFRPRSGLFQKKTGFHGKKIRSLPPPKVYGTEFQEVVEERMELTTNHNNNQYHIIMP